MAKWTGRDLMPMPFESLTSVLERFAWHNALDSNLMIKCFTRSGIGRKLDLQMFADDTYGQVIADLKTGRPYYGNTWCSPRFRFCPVCLQDLYHTHLFQYWQVHSCPMHGVVLQTQCQSCGKPTPKVKENECLHRRPYECKACNKPCAGAMSDWQGHLRLRESIAFVHDRLAPIAAWLAGSAERRTDINGMRWRPDRSLQHAWCRPEMLLRALDDRRVDDVPEISTNANTWPPTSRLVWRCQIAPRKPFEFGLRYKVASPKETLMYRHTLRVLLKRVCSKLGITELEAVTLLERFNVRSSQTLALELLAMGFMRLQSEGILGMEDTAVLRPLHTAQPLGENWLNIRWVGTDGPRVAYYAAYLSLFAAWYHIARRFSVNAVWSHLRTTPTPEQMVLLRNTVWHRMGERWMSGVFERPDEVWAEGEAVTLAIPGLQLFPNWSQHHLRSRMLGFRAQEPLK
ncbi:hypothetical protein RugamoR57_03550 [Duganella caerulea]|uniref:hypothetical protein n=1 Tax=Duganella caerulea TaxID=2885762 RepID=UPI0030E797EB